MEELSINIKRNKTKQTNKKTQFKNGQKKDFPGGAVVNNPPASAGDTGSIPGPGRSHMPQNN